MQIVTHADDCGLSRGITSTILDCARSGALLGASVMASGDCAEEAARGLAHAIPSRHGLPVVGVHVNILEGRALLPPEQLPLLVRPDGTFRHNLGSLCLALAGPSSRKKQALLDEVAAEWTAQAARIQTAIPSSRLYLDGHLHAHVLPALRPALFALLQEFPIDYVRVPSEPRYSLPAPLRLQIIGNIRRELLRLWSHGLREQLHKRGVRTPDCFLGAFCSGAMTMPRLVAGLAHAQKILPGDALTEIMFHPGGFGPEDTNSARHLPYRDFYLAPARKEEKALLSSPEFHQLLLRHDSTWQGSL